MTLQATLTGVDLPTTSQVSVKIEVNTEINVSAYVARQKANRFLIMQAGDQLCSGEPELVIGPTLFWRVPVLYAPSRQGVLGIVGHLRINSTTGEVSIADGQTAEDLLERADTLYARTAP
jgi:hypothetical protein